MYRARFPQTESSPRQHQWVRLNVPLEIVRGNRRLHLSDMYRARLLLILPRHRRRHWVNLNQARHRGNQRLPSYSPQHQHNSSDMDLNMSPCDFACGRTARPPSNSHLQHDCIDLNEARHQRTSSRSIFDPTIARPSRPPSYSPRDPQFDWASRYQATQPHMIPDHDTSGSFCSHPTCSPSSSPGHYQHFWPGPNHASPSHFVPSNFVPIYY